MAKIFKKHMTIGSRIRLKEDLDMGYCIYAKGHEFKITGESQRGFNLEDDEGNRVTETGLVHHILELI